MYISKILHTFVPANQQIIAMEAVIIKYLDEIELVLGNITEQKDGIIVLETGTKYPYDNHNPFITDDPQAEYKTKE